MTQNPEDFYTKLKLIGSGSFGDVYKGIDNKTQENVAIKVVDLDAVDDEIEDLQREIAILAELDSPFITKYIGSYLKGTQLWIIMEYLGGGSIADLLKPGPFKETEIAVILRESLLGLDYMHSQKKLHRDIKAANILLSSSGEVKLGDFGVSGKLTDTLSKRNTFVGTPFWMAPEIILHTPHTYTADIWSLGITAIELAEGDPPRSHLHPYKVLFEIPKADPPTLDDDENFSDEFISFIATCLKKNATERPSAKDLLNHPFICSAKKTSLLQDLIERYEAYKAMHSSEDDMSDDGDSDDDDDDSDDPDIPEWQYDTVKPNTKFDIDSNNGTIKGKSSTKKKSSKKKFESSGEDDSDSEGFDFGTVKGASASSKNNSGKRAMPDLDADSTVRKSSAPSSTSSSSSAGIENISFFLEKLKGNEHQSDVVNKVDNLKKSFEELEAVKPGFTASFVQSIKDGVLSSSEVRKSGDISDYLLTRWKES